jgi:tetratricopeptide (TPR) repeat protein
MHLIRILACLLCWQAAAVLAAPFTPSADQQVLERLPTRAADPRSAELRQWRQQLSQQPGNAELAVRLARRYFEEVAAEGDPRYIGYAQAALAPWWALPDPPVDVRVMRALLRQFNHDFDAAVADLKAAVQQQPAHGEAWSWLAAIAMVQARYADARTACERLAPLASGLIGAACLASVDSVTGQSSRAVQSLQAALAQPGAAEPPERLWALTRLAETLERRGDFAAAEAAYRQALALGITDGYLQAAYADFLLDRGRAPEVLVLLKDRQRSDLLLLRLALAARAAQATAAKDWTAELAARFDAARLRGDSSHEKEESRFALALQGDKARALSLARQNFAVQREPADARVLLEAAVAAGDAAAAQPVLQWMQSSGVESVQLRMLAARLKGAS